ncbi:MAG: PhoX family protein [Planctomycetota bacterium]
MEFGIWEMSSQMGKIGWMRGRLGCDDRLGSERLAVPIQMRNLDEQMPVKSILVVIVISMSATVTHAQFQGPSTLEQPYTLPLVPGVETVSLLTVGESVNMHPDGVTPYRLVGIPDGLGAYNNGDGTFTLLVNHELDNDEGVVRAHGGIGAFISRWTINASTLAVLYGEDLILKAFVWNTATGSYQLSPSESFGRFCSANLPAAGAFYNAESGLGTLERIHINGEENGTNGRAFAHVLSGPNARSSFELARCGNFNFENAVAAAESGDSTVVISLDDSNGGQIYVYVGQKTDKGSEIDRAGLTNGHLFGLVVEGLPAEIPANGLGGAASTPFYLHEFGDVSAMSGNTLQSLSEANNVTEFLRPEDGHYDPQNPDDFYWVTTGASGAPGRLWRLRFDDIGNPEVGGIIDLVLDGTEGVVKPDNITVDKFGRALIQEDLGNTKELGRIWTYDIEEGGLTAITQQASNYFLSGPDFMTINDESSGIIDAHDLIGDCWYLFDVQAHYDIGDPELVQGGQLLAMLLPSKTGTICGATAVPSVSQWGLVVMVILLLIGATTIFAGKCRADTP